jgi:WD40 repeat protein
MTQLFVTILINGNCIHPEHSIAPSNDNTVRLWDVQTKEAIQIFSTEGSIKCLSFSSDGLYLKTERGLFKLNCLYRTVGQPQSDFLLYLYVTKQWVACRTENILWIPADYRPKRFVVRDNILGMRYTSGQITFIEFDLASVPRVRWRSRTAGTRMRLRWQ